MLVNGKKEVKKITINNDAKDLINDDLTMLEDMIVLALNDAFSQVDKFKESKLGKYASMMQGIM